MKTLRVWVSLGLLIYAAPVRAEDAGFRVIVHAQNPVTSLSRDQVSRLFLKKTVKWDSGQPVHAVDQAASTPVRDAFSQAVHRRSTGQVKSYWQQQVFSGQNVPPPERASDREVVAFVLADPNAIGYVSSSAAVVGAKVVAIVE